MATRWRTVCALAALSALASILTVMSVGAGASSAGPQPPGLDHFTCYTAAAAAGTSVKGFATPPAVLLKNQFNSFLAATGPITLHCNPTEKILPTGQVFPSNNPSWHLLCWAIKPNSNAAVFPVRVTNQFGNQIPLVTKPPTTLCLPSLKSTQNPPVFQPPGPNEVQPDHTTCYPVAYPAAGGPVFTPPPFVTIKDQFQSVNVKVGPPVALCIPTAKTVVPGKPPTPINNPRAHLLCFIANPATQVTPRTVFDQNQFGTGAVSINATRLLCLPSFKVKG
jgi:hypothetical protein